MNNKTEKRFPPIGMRIIKSAVGVLLCYVADIFRAGQGIVFYSQLAVLWCMQDYKKDTLSQAKQRLIGTAVGALYGLIVIVLSPVLKTGKAAADDLIAAVLISLFIVFVIYTTVVIRKKNASYFSCVVFLSIVVNHISDANPFMFVWNRVLDTLIGIALGVFVNSFGLPRKRRNDILFVSGLDDTLLSKNDNLSDYSRVELNRMIENGAKFTVSTMRTPASLMEPLRNIELKLPMIVMDGAALFDIKQKRYLLTYVISSDCSEQIINYFDKMEFSYFTNVIIDDLLMIYYQDSENEVYNEVVNTLRSSPYRNYIKRPVPEGEQTVYFMLIDKKERMKALYEGLREQSFSSRLKILFYDSVDYPGCSYIKIYNHNATRENMLMYLKKELEVNEIVTFGTIEGRYTHLIKAGDSNAVVNLMRVTYEPYAWKKVWIR